MIIEQYISKKKQASKDVEVMIDKKLSEITLLQKKLEYLESELIRLYHGKYLVKKD